LIIKEFISDSIVFSLEENIIQKTISLRKINKVNCQTLLLLQLPLNTICSWLLII